MNDEAVTLMREIEWAGSAWAPMCPKCRRLRGEGHARDCTLAAFIKVSGTEPLQVVMDDLGCPVVHD
jgi:hypothetical protein